MATHPKNSPLSSHHPWFHGFGSCICLPNLVLCAGSLLLEGIIHLSTSQNPRSSLSLPHSILMTNPESILHTLSSPVHHAMRPLLPLSFPPRSCGNHLLPGRVSCFHWALPSPICSQQPGWSFLKIEIWPQPLCARSMHSRAIYLLFLFKFN